MSRTLEEQIENDFTLNAEQLSDFIKMMSPHFFDGLRWAKHMNFLKGNEILSFGNIRTVETKVGGKDVITYYPDRDAVRNFFSGMRKRGFKWLTGDLESWASEKAITPLDVVEKVMNMYDSKINYEKAQIYSFQESYNPIQTKGWINTIFEKLGKEFKKI